MFFRDIYYIMDNENDSCKKRIVINNFIQSYNSKQSDRYDANILKNYIMFYSIINDIIQNLPKDDNNIITYFENLPIENQRIFLRHDAVSYTQFLKYKPEIKIASIIYFFRLYQIHTPIVDEFYRVCKEKNEESSLLPTPSRLQQQLEKYLKKYGDQSQQIPIREPSRTIMERIRPELLDQESLYNIPDVTTKAMNPFSRNNSRGGKPRKYGWKRRTRKRR